MRIINILLLLIVIVGGVFALQARMELDAINVAHRRLTAKLGRVSVSDTTKIHVMPLKTDEPLDFAWQVYLPAGLSGTWKTRSGGGSTTSSMRSREGRLALVRVRFREIDGNWFVWCKSSEGSTTSDVQHSEWLKKPETLSIVQAGRDEIEVFEVDEVVDLLTIVSKELPPSTAREQVIYAGQFGSQGAWAKRQSTRPATYE